MGGPQIATGTPCYPGFPTRRRGASNPPCWSCWLPCLRFAPPTHRAAASLQTSCHCTMLLGVVPRLPSLRLSALLFRLRWTIVEPRRLLTKFIITTTNEILSTDPLLCQHGQQGT